MSYKDILKQRAKKNNLPKLLGSLHISDIIKSPIMTEKSSKMAEGQTVDGKKTFSFIVDQRANKNDVKIACKSMFGVDVEKVRTVSLKPKGRSHKKLVRHACKKSYITLPLGQSIESN